MTQAVLEGVAFAMRDCLTIARKTGIVVKEAKLTGGGAKSPLWRRICANVLDVDIQIIESEEGPGYGGAILAAVACGEYASVEEAAEKLVKVVDVIHPDPQIVARYDKAYEKFTKLYPAVKELY